MAIYPEGMADGSGGLAGILGYLGLDKEQPKPLGVSSASAAVPMVSPENRSLAAMFSNLISPATSAPQPQSLAAMFQPSMQDVMLSIGAQLAKNSAPSTRRVGMFEGVPDAMIQARQLGQQRGAQALRSISAVGALEDRADKKAQRERQAAYIAQLPPDQRPLAALAPEQFISARASQMFPKQKDAQIFGSAESGYYTLGPDMKPIPLVSGQRKPEYRERDVPLEGDKLQKQISHDGGMTWQAIGPAYDRRDPMVIQQLWNPAAQALETVAIPRSALSGGGAAPAPAGAPVATPGAETAGAPGAVPSANGLPPGSRVLGQSQPKPPSTEEQKVRALVGEAQSAIGLIKPLLFQNGDPDKIVNRSNVAAMQANLPGTDGARLRQAFESAFNNMVYLKTGAAATPSELDKAVATYMPKTWDTADIIKQKLRLMEDFLSRYEAGKAAMPRVPQQQGGGQSAAQGGGAAQGGSTPPIPPGFRLVE